MQTDIYADFVSVFLAPDFLLGVLRSIDDDEQDLLTISCDEVREMPQSKVNFLRYFLSFPLLAKLAMTAKYLWTHTVVPVGTKLRHAVVTPLNIAWLDKVLSNGHALGYVRLESYRGAFPYGNGVKTLVLSNEKYVPPASEYPDVETLVDLNISAIADETLLFCTGARRLRLMVTSDCTIARGWKDKAFAFTLICLRESYMLDVHIRHGDTGCDISDCLTDYSPDPRERGHRLLRTRLVEEIWQTLRLLYEYSNGTLIYVRWSDHVQRINDLADRCDYCYHPGRRGQWVGVLQASADPMGSITDADISHSIAWTSVRHGIRAALRRLAQYYPLFDMEQDFRLPDAWRRLYGLATEEHVVL